MKIIFLTTCYPRKSQPHNGVFIHRQAKALRELGAEVHIVQPSIWFPPFGIHRFHLYWEHGYSDFQDMHDELEGIPLHHPKAFVKMPSRFFPENHWERMGKTVGRYIKRHSQLKDADWIYAHFLCHEGYAGKFASDMTGIPLAAIARGDDVHAWPENNPSLVRNLRIVFQKANLLLANSQALALDTVKWFENGKKKSINVIYNGVDLDTFFPVKSESDKLTYRRMFPKIPQDKRLLLCVATPVILKGWLELLDVIMQLGSGFSNWNLIMVAPPRTNQDKLDLIKESRTRGISDKVTYMGKIEPKEMPNLMKAMDAFILPSYNEGMANALMEALASGLPSIATDVGGHREVYGALAKDFLFSPRDKLSLLQTLKSLIDNIQKNSTYNFRLLVEKNFKSYIANSQKLMELFNQ